MISLPKPGESIYKYATAGGLFLVVSSVALSARSLIEARDRLFEITSEISTAGFELAWLNLRVSELLTAYPQLRDFTVPSLPNLYSDTAWAQTLRPVACTRDPAGSALDARVPCSSFTELQDLQQQILWLSLTVTRTTEHSFQVSRENVFLYFLGGVGVLVGGLIFVVGLIAWFVTYQLPHDVAVAEQLLAKMGRTTNR